MTNADLLNQLFYHSVPVHLAVHVAVLAIRNLVQFVLKAHDCLNIFYQIDTIAVELDSSIDFAFHDERSLLRDKIAHNREKTQVSKRAYTPSGERIKDSEGRR